MQTNSCSRYWCCRLGSVAPCFRKRTLVKFKILHHNHRSCSHQWPNDLWGSCEQYIVCDICKTAAVVTFDLLYDVEINGPSVRHLTCTDTPEHIPDWRNTVTRWLLNATVHWKTSFRNVHILQAGKRDGGFRCFYWLFHCNLFLSDSVTWTYKLGLTI